MIRRCTPGMRGDAGHVCFPPTSKLYRCGRRNPPAKEISAIHWHGGPNRGIRVVMPKKPKVVPIPKSTGSEQPRTPQVRDRVLTDQLILKIGPMVFAVNYAVKVSELKTVARDATGRVVPCGKI